MSFDRAKYIEFYDHLNVFCIQAIIGAIAALHRTIPEELTSYHRSVVILNNADAIAGLVKIYMNQCWESYHQETDATVYQAIRELLDVGIVQYTSCLFNVMASYIRALLYVLSQLPNELIVQMKTLDLTRFILRHILIDAGTTIKNGIIQDQRSISCTLQCEPYSYAQGESICY